MIERRNKIGNIIFRSEDVMEIQTLVELYSEVIGSLEEIDDCTRAFEATQRGICNLLMSIRKE